MISGKNLFLTGGFGFIGSALAERLLLHNRITLFDNGTRRSSRLARFAEHPNVRLVNGDVLDKQSISVAIKDSDIVIHLAGIAGVSNYYRMPTRTMEVTLLGMYNMLEAVSHRGGIERFVFLSTSEVFGPRAWRVREDSPTQQGDVADRRWTYAVAKLAAEKLAMCYYWERQLPIVSLRPFNIYGPGQAGEGAIHNFTIASLRNEPLQITGDGAQLRSWCYIDDMVSAIEASLLSQKAIGQVYNIGNPESTVTVLDLGRQVVTLSGSSSPIHFVPHIGVDIDIRVPDISKARAELGYRPQVNLQDGLRRTIEWYREIKA